MSNFNSDVEFVYNTIENEFYDLEYFILNIISFLKFLLINFIIISFVKILIKKGIAYLITSIFLKNFFIFFIIFFCVNFDWHISNKKNFFY